MNRRLIRPILWGVAILTVIAGVVSSLGTLRQLEEATPRLERKREEIRELRSLARDAATQRSALAAFEQMDATGESLESLLATVLPGQVPRDPREQHDTLRPGWIVHRWEIALRDVPFADALRFAQAAESQRPPWRVTTCVLRGSPRQEAGGEILLQFERIEKQAP